MKEIYIFWVKYSNLSNTGFLTLKDWASAESNCRAIYGGSLAAPSTELGNAYIKQQLTEYYAVVNPSEQVRVWMGAYKYLSTNGYEWRFTNEEPYTYGDWVNIDFRGLKGAFTSPSFSLAVWEARAAYPYVCEHKLCACY